MDFEGEVDLGKGSIIMQDVSFVVEVTVRNYYLEFCDY